MTAKVFEIRDAGTFIPVLAVKLGSENDQERWLLGSAGFGTESSDQEKYVVLVQINGGLGKATCDPYDWGQNPRTYIVAHRHIEAHFDDLEPGAVVDVEFLLGEAATKKVSDRRIFA